MTMYIYDWTRAPKLTKTHFEILFLHTEQIARNFQNLLNEEIK